MSVPTSTCRLAISASAAREIGYMFGQYKRITNEFTGVLTGKGLEYGGTPDPHRGDRLWRDLFPAEHAGAGGQLDRRQDLRHLRLWQRRHPCRPEDSTHLGGKVLTLSDSAGFIHDPDGIDPEKVNWVKQHKTQQRGRIADYVEEFPGREFHRGKRPWGVKCDIAMPMRARRMSSMARTQRR